MGNWGSRKTLLNQQWKPWLYTWFSIILVKQNSKFQVAVLKIGKGWICKLHLMLKNIIWKTNSKDVVCSLTWRDFGLGCLHNIHVCFMMKTYFVYIQTVGHLKQIHCHASNFRKTILNSMHSDMRIGNLHLTHSILLPR